ncbi:hypothetical protein ACK3BE_23240 [Pseudomonas mandelii]|uniref:hypothetical protein n=1 Tax=Pseudomonas mandelii TaxID=75612 RepID=UPI00398CA435
MNSTRTPLTAPSVKVNLDTLDWKDTGIRLASREDFFPYNGVNVTIADPCLAPDNELELLLDDKVIARHIITTADAGSPLTIHVKPEDLTDGRHELSYRVKINNQPFQTCEQRAEIHVALRSLTDLRLEKASSRHHGPFAQIQISYPHAAPPGDAGERQYTDGPGHPRPHPQPGCFTAVFRSIPGWQRQLCPRNGYPYSNNRSQLLT